MVVSVAKATAIAVPICIVIWLGIVLLALAAADWPGSWASAIALGAVVGVLAGVFFGGWAGVLTAAHTLDAADAHRRLSRTAAATVSRLIGWSISRNRSRGRRRRQPCRVMPPSTTRF